MSGEDFALDARGVSHVFPFHLRLGRNQEVISTGPSIRRLLGCSPIGSSLEDLGSIERPLISNESSMILEGGSTTFVLRLKQGVRLRGPMITIATDQTVLFACSLWVNSWEEVRALGLEVRDFAAHDAQLDLLFALQATRASLRELKEANESILEQRREIRAHREAAESSRHEGD